MDNCHVQTVPAAEEFAPRPIDGIHGSKNKLAIKVAAALLGVANLSASRWMVGVVQACLNDLGAVDEHLQSHSRVPV